MDANAIAIISNQKHTYPYILSHFIQLFSWKYHESNWVFELYITDYFKFFKKCPFLDTQRIRKDIINKHWRSNIDFIIDMLNQGYYIYLIVNTRYISSYKPSRTHDLNHDMFIYGYDQIENEFFIADNFNHGAYSFEKCSYSELENALGNLNPDKIDVGFNNAIYLLSYKESNTKLLDLNRIQQGIRAYLDGTEFDDCKDPNGSYGIEVYQDYQSYISLLKLGQAEIDYRPIHVFYEHKFLMWKRIEYLCEHGILRDDSKLLQEFEQISKWSIVIRNLVLKFSITKDKELLDKIPKQLDVIKCTETDLLEEVLSQFK